MKALCSISGCGRKVLARGWCGKHYQRWQKHGDASIDLPDSPETRFWASLNKTATCWLWTGVVAGRYGQMTVDRNRVGTAHRFSWQLHFGPIAPGQFVCHRCDNPICVRPDHLFLGDASANMRDMVAKGRHPKQRNSYRRKLDEEKVLAIRASDEGTSVLALRYQVDQSTILHIRKRLNWRHI